MSKTKEIVAANAKEMKKMTDQLNANSGLTNQDQYNLIMLTHTAGFMELLAVISESLEQISNIMRKRLEEEPENMESRIVDALEEISNALYKE